MQCSPSSQWNQHEKTFRYQKLFFLFWFHERIANEKKKTKLTVPTASNQFGSKANRPIVLTVWIDANLLGHDDWLQRILDLAVRVDVRRQNLFMNEKNR